MTNKITYIKYVSFVNEFYTANNQSFKTLHQLLQINSICCSNKKHEL